MIYCPAQLQWGLLRFSLRDHLLPLMLTCRWLALPLPVFYKVRLKCLGIVPNSRLSPGLLLFTRQKVNSCCKSKHQHQCWLYVHHGPCQRLVVCPLSPQTTVMSQVEKKAGLLRRTSSSKKPLKEKVVLMYDDIFSVSIKRADVLIERN